jgi:hypothetical protein
MCWTLSSSIPARNKWEKENQQDHCKRQLHIFTVQKAYRLDSGDLGCWQLSFIALIKILLLLLKSAKAVLPSQGTSSVLKEEHVTAFEDEGSYVIPDQQDPLVCRGILDLEETDMPEPLAPESYPESICEEDVTLALKELDERCEEEEADFSGLSRWVWSCIQ